MEQPRLDKLCFDALPGWASASLADVWHVFRRAAAQWADGKQPLRPAQEGSEALRAIWTAAREAPPELSDGDARRFFEAHFQPYRVGAAGAGFATGYYEPIVEGTLRQASPDQAPIRPRPADLVTFAAGDPRPGGLDGYTAARRLADGTLAVYPDRATIEAMPAEDALVWLRDWVEVFLIQVQGSARVRLADGSEHRLTYAGRNGHPYTSVGRLLIESGEIAPDAMSLDRLKAWLRSAGQAQGQPGRTTMQRNRSYIFFDRHSVDADDLRGPTGGAGLPLTPKLSIAIDRSIWSFGLPFWIASEAPVPGFGDRALSRLFLAEDTGSAILGPARADLFVGSGEEAGRAAGSIRHAATFTVLLPRQP